MIRKFEKHGVLRTTIGVTIAIIGVILILIDVFKAM